MIFSLIVPTPGILELSNYYIVQSLIIERIKSVVTGKRFLDNFEGIVAANLEPPPYCNTPRQTEDWVTSTAREISSVFELYERTPEYLQATTLLRNYEGWGLNILSCNVNGVIIGLIKPTEEK